MSISLPKSARVSSKSPLARINRFLSSGFISTKMSMSLLALASPRATEPKRSGLEAPYFSSKSRNSSVFAANRARNCSVSGVRLPGVSTNTKSCYQLATIVSLLVAIYSRWKGAITNRRFTTFIPSRKGAERARNGRTRRSISPCKG